MPSAAIAEDRDDEHRKQQQRSGTDPGRAQPDIGRQRREGADRKHVAMGELDDVEHAEEQREADRDERIHHAEHEPVHDVLGKQPDIHVFDPTRVGKAKRDGNAGAARPACIAYFCPGSLRLPRGVFAVVPLHELAVLDHVFGDHGHGVLAVVVEGDLADDGVAVLHVGRARR